jgi:putative mRNA 3-end processing factor
VLVHAAVARLNEAYRAAGVALPEVETVTPDTPFKTLRGALVIAPPAVQDSRWAKALGPHSDAFASGWMRLRGARRRRSVDRGFVFSDHADWPGLLSAIHATGAGRVIVTHGDEGALVRYLGELGLQAEAFATEFGDEAAEAAA